jgi:ABC-type antimicrobial peptide transport system permease subunit
MTWTDSLGLATRSLRRRPGRALLTILAVALGTTLLVALGSVASTAGSRIVSKLSNGGPGTAIKVAASQADADQAYTDDLRATGSKPISDSTIATLRRSPQIATVIPVMASQVLVVPPPFGSKAASTKGPLAFGSTMVGVDCGRRTTCPSLCSPAACPARGR